MYRRHTPPLKSIHTETSKRSSLVHSCCDIQYIYTEDKYLDAAKGARHIAWWRHQMETFSALLAICAGNSPVPGEFPAQMPVTRSFDILFDPGLNKQLSKQLWGWWFEKLSCSLWRHCNGLTYKNICSIATEWQDQFASVLQWRHYESNGVSNHRRLHCLLNHLLRHRSKKTSKSRVTGLCEGSPLVTGVFPSQRVSNAKNVSIW